MLKKFGWENVINHMEESWKVEQSDAFFRSASIVCCLITCFKRVPSLYQKDAFFISSLLLIDIIQELQYLNELKVVYDIWVRIQPCMDISTS